MSTLPPPSKHPLQAHPPVYLPSSPPTEVSQGDYRTREFFFSAGGYELALLIILVLLGTIKFFSRRRQLNGDHNQGRVRAADFPIPQSESPNRSVGVGVGAGQVIAAMEFKFTRRDRGFVSESSSEVCAICLEEFTEGEICRSLIKCSHWFHRDCIDLWLRRDRHCPLCRDSVHCRVAIIPINPAQRETPLA